MVQCIELVCRESLLIESRIQSTMFWTSNIVQYVSNGELEKLTYLAEFLGERAVVHVPDISIFENHGLELNAADVAVRGSPQNVHFRLWMQRRMTDPARTIQWHHRFRILTHLNFTFIHNFTKLILSKSGSWQLKSVDHVLLRILVWRRCVASLIKLLCQENQNFFKFLFSF